MNRFHAPHRTPGFLRRIFFLPLLPIVVAHAAAQLGSMTLTLQNGLSASLPQAKSAFGDDLILTTVIGIGGGSSEPSAALIDFQSEAAAMWSYAYYSPSKQETYMAHVTKVDTGYSVILPGPSAAAGTETALDLSRPYAPASTLPARLAADSAYTRYRAAYPALTPTFAILGNYGIPDPLWGRLPEWFPQEQKNWQITYTTLTGDELTCIVAVETGESFCVRRVPASVSVPCTGERPRGAASLTAVPNPASKQVRIDVNRSSDGPSPIREVALFDAQGARIRDLTPSYLEHGRSFVEIETSGLVPGLYLCRVDGDGWSESIGVMVGRQ